MRYGTHLLPFFLESDEFVASFLPVCTVSQFLCLVYELLFLFEIGRVGIFQSFEEFSLLVEEFIVGDAETLKNLDVHFLRGKTDSAPLFLNLYDFLGNLLPVLSSLVFSLVGSLYLSQRALFLARFSSSLARRSSKCCWCFLLITVLAALKRSQICSLNSLATGPISRYCWWRS